MSKYEIYAYMHNISDIKLLDGKVHTKEMITENKE